MEKPKLNQDLSVKQDQALPVKPRLPHEQEFGQPLKHQYVVGKHGSVKNRPLSGK